MTIHLPFEILTAIFEQVDDVRDLRHVRIASRAFCAVATPLAFRVLSVTSTGGSAHNLGRLFDVPEIAAYVREVAYCDAGADWRKSIRFPELKFVRTRAIPELASSFSRIHQLPQLETINLVFSPADRLCLHSDSKCRLALQASILGALTDSFGIRAPSKLASLYLHNLHTWDLTPLKSTSFQTTLKRLQRLRLSVVYDPAKDEVTSLHRYSHFWGALLHRSVLSQTQHTLTELTLRSDLLAGASSEFSFTGLQFPYLCALSLRKFLFEPSVGVESFILQHGATLSRLELIMCKLPIDTEPSSTPTYWGHIWDSFSTELTALVALRVHQSGGDGLKCGYIRREPVVSSWDRRATKDLDAADDVALRRFYVTVAARSEERRNSS